ncbi:hypothetical protein KK141_05795 [Dyella sp. LX-66]|uniref:hypothetical protein n=1 Tax=unclassified Dyella TaxID=2634549 RepID=UPI001BE1264F|nr:MULTISPECIES: hypothetical protein [unclassified Dyella]MBT2116781.1 hypothetical protein [Dyella sp. LX-1]MBT2139039.1 hypothetical protein [Dyella sp. LX-66]
MTWFAASLIVGIKRIGVTHGPSVAYENVVLIEAGTAAEALHKARDHGDAYVSVDDGLTLNGEPAIRVFAGIRKLTIVSNPYPLDLDQGRPTSGTEVTYSLFELESDDALALLAAGEEVSLRYIE